MIYHNILQTRHKKRRDIYFGIEVNYYVDFIANIQEAPPKELKNLFLETNVNQYSWKNIDNLFNTCMGSRSVLFTMLEHLRDESYDFSTIKDMSVKWVDLFVAKIEEYSLFETRKFLLKMLDHLREADTRTLAYINLNIIQQYISKIFLWVDAYIPWKELCEKYAEVKGDKKPDI